MLFEKFKIEFFNVFYLKAMSELANRLPNPPPCDRTEPAPPAYETIAHLPGSFATPPIPHDLPPAYSTIAQSFAALPQDLQPSCITNATSPVITVGAADLINYDECPEQESDDEEQVEQCGCCAKRDEKSERDEQSEPDEEQSECDEQSYCDDDQSDYNDDQSDYDDEQSEQSECDEQDGASTSATVFNPFSILQSNSARNSLIKHMGPQPYNYLMLPGSILVNADVPDLGKDLYNLESLSEDIQNETLGAILFYAGFPAGLANSLATSGYTTKIMQTLQPVLFAPSNRLREFVRVLMPFITQVSILNDDRVWLYQFTMTPAQAAGQAALRRQNMQSA